MALSWLSRRVAKMFPLLWIRGLGSTVMYSCHFYFE